MQRLFVLLIVLFALALGGLTTARGLLAQDATPPVGEVIDPSECRVEPRSIESIEQLVGTPTAGAAMGTPAVTEVGPLTGEPADQATVEAVTATYRELVACLNAGDYLRVYALYTDDYLRRNLAEGRQDIAGLRATPSPVGEQERTALVSVRNVRVLADGRVAARVETYDPAAGGTVVIDAILVQSGDRYLIDAETVVDAPQIGGTPVTAATPEGAAEGVQVEVVSYDIYFEPAQLTIPANTDVVVSLPNLGVAPHNFSIDALGIDVDIQPGATEQTTINAPDAVYEFYCNVPGHKQAGMVGTLTVE